MEQATFGGGCFWCTEAIFQRLIGVESVVPGYSGGKQAGETPSYEQVSTGATGHAEAVQITYDPKIISFSRLLEIFFETHDPTTKNRQGADIGTQYRSVIFYHNQRQKDEALKMIKNQDDSKKLESQIVTEVVPFEKFYTAEEYHQNYYNKNKITNPYCMLVINPKINKLIEKFNSSIKSEYR